MRKGFHKRAEESTVCQRLLLILSDTCQASLVEQSPQRFVQVPPEFLPQLMFPQALSPNRNRKGQSGTIGDLLGQMIRLISFQDTLYPRGNCSEKNENKGIFSCRRCHKYYSEMISAPHFDSL